MLNEAPPHSTAAKAAVTDGSGSLREFALLAPSALVVAFWLLSSTFSGAYFADSWYPAAIVAVVICPLLLAAGWRLPIGGTRASLALLTAFVAWSAASILWADAGGHALEATNKLVLALATAFIFAVTPWSERLATWLLGFFSVGVFVICLTTLLSAAGAADPSGSFIEERFAEPLGYAGASAAFAGLAVWPALALSARRSAPAWLRAILFGIAVAQVELALLPQSRGILIGLAISAPLFLAFSAARGWATVRVLVVAAVAAATVGPILDVYTTASHGGDVPAALDDAVRGIALALALAFALGWLLVALERRRPELLGAATVRRYRVPALAAGLGALVVLTAVFGGRLGSEASDRWQMFIAGEDDSAQAEVRLVSTGDPQRHDYWRVALDSAEEEPLIGIGAGNFQDAYAIHRHEEKHSRYAHNLWLRVLGETGIVGLLLLVSALLAAGVAVARRRRDLQPTAQLLAAGALAASALVFAHSSVDWVEEFPAILGPAVGFLFLAGRLAAPPPPGPARRQALALVTGVVVCGVALIGLIPAYLAIRYTEYAEQSWTADREAAYNDLDRATYFNPLSSQPELTRGEIAIALSEEGRARTAFEHAADKEDNWYPHFELALIASSGGDRAEAVAQMRAARRLNPTDPLVQESLAALNRGRRLDPLTVEAQIRAETSERFSNRLRR